MSYSGHVYNKTTGLPMADIKVCDGKNIVKTDAFGAFLLPGWERARMINVSLLTTAHADWYMRIDNRESDYDFYVTPANTSECTFFHISDTEIGANGCGEWLSFIKRKIAERHPTFLVHTGDICYLPGLLRHYKDLNGETAGCPVRYVIGNHDYINDNYGEYTYENHYGPAWYSFDCGGVHFAAVPIQGGDAASGYDPCDRWVWLKNDLAAIDPSMKTVILDHDCCPDENGFTVDICGEKYSVAEHGLIAWIYGHYHYHFINNINNIFNICTARPDCGGIDSSPSGVRELKIRNGKLSSEMLYNDPSLVAPAEKAVWRTKLPGHVQFSTPVEYEGDIFVATTDDGYPKECGVFRLDGMTGAVKWGFFTENSVKNDIAIYNNKVYAEDSAGRLYSISAADGKLINTAFSPLSFASHTHTGVIAADGKVFAGSTAQVYCYDAETLDLIWKMKRIGGESSPARYAYDRENGLLICSSHWNTFYALDVNTGEMAWNLPAPILRFRSSTPLISDGKIYVGALNTIFVIDLKKGEIIEKKDVDFKLDVSAAPVKDGNVLLFSTVDKGVAALDINTFETIRTYHAGKAHLYTSPYTSGAISTVEGAPLILGENLAFTASDGLLSIYEKDTAAYVKGFSLGAPSLVSPVKCGKLLVAADFSGSVAAFDL